MLMTSSSSYTKYNVKRTKRNTKASRQKVKMIYSHFKWLILRYLDKHLKQAKQSKHQLTIYTITSVILVSLSVSVCHLFTLLSLLIHLFFHFNVEFRIFFFVFCQSPARFITIYNVYVCVCVVYVCLIICQVYIFFVNLKWK